MGGDNEVIVSYQYDAGGNQTKQTHPDGFAVDFTYDALNRVTAAKDGARTLASVGYDFQSRRQSVTYDNGASAQYAYTPRSDLICHDWNLTGAAPASCNTGTPEIAYDLGFNGVGQMISRQVSDPLLRWSPSGNDTDAYTPNGLNQYTNVDGASPIHDANGNMTTDYRGWTYQYSAENQLVWVKDTALVRQGFYIDYADGTRRYVNRPGVGTHRYYYDGDQEIIETDRAGESTIGAANVLRRYIRLPGSVDEPFLMIDFTINGSCTNTSYAACERWAHQNYLGSVVAVTDSAGAATDVNKYDEYGVPDGSNAGRMSYTGQMWLPDQQLHHYKARAYNAETGRFMQPDPIGYGDGMNIYAYVGGDPINSIDPSGLRSGRGCITGGDCSDWTNFGGFLGGGLTVASGAGTRSEREADSAIRERRNRRKERQCDQELIDQGNFLVNASNYGGDIAAGVVIVGGAVLVAGAVAASVPITGAAVTILAVGGAIATVSGAARTYGGFLQGRGGGGYQNVVRGLASVAFGVGGRVGSAAARFFNKAITATEARYAQVVGGVIADVVLLAKPGEPATCNS